MINRDKNLFLQHADNITAITSGIGSMGKTWLSITLSHAVNILRQTVLLFDADNGLMNIGEQLGISPEYSLDKVAAGSITLNQAVVGLNRKKFDIIVAQAGSNALEQMPIGRLQILRDEFVITAQRYDNVLIDLPVSEKIMTHFLPEIKDLILVCTNDPSNLVATYNFLQDSVGLIKYRNIKIIVNYANSHEEGLQTYNILRHACEQYLKMTPPLLGVIRRDTRVRDAIRNHALLFNSYPDSEVAEDIMQIARHLVGKGEVI